MSEFLKVGILVMRESKEEIPLITNKTKQITKNQKQLLCRVKKILIEIYPDLQK